MDKAFQLIKDYNDFTHPFFSVIMISYNAGKYIEQSIRNVYNQTFQNFQLIIVNDCSTDETDDIIKKHYDNRLTYIKNDVNQGVGISRDVSLSFIKGKYVIFVDADDEIDKNLLAVIKNEIDLNNPDYIIYSFEEKYINHNNQILFKKNRIVSNVYNGVIQYLKDNSSLNDDIIKDNKLCNIYITDKIIINNLFIFLENATILGYPWNKCYKANLIKDNDLHFEDVLFYEDILFNVDYYKNVKSLSLIDDILYVYNINISQKSVSRKKTNKYFDLCKKRIYKVYSYLKDYNLINNITLKILQEKYIRYLYSTIIRCIDDKFSKKEISAIIQSIATDDLYKILFIDYKLKNGLNIYKLHKFSFINVMRKVLLSGNTNMIIFISKIIKFVNEYIYVLYLRLSK